MRRYTAHPLPRGHRSSHVNQAFVFVRVIYYYLALYIALLALLPARPVLPCTPVFASPSRRRTMRHRAHKLFVCISDARTGMTLRPFFVRHLAPRRFVPSVASRFTCRGLSFFPSFLPSFLFSSACLYRPSSRSGRLF